MSPMGPAILIASGLPGDPLHDRAFGRAGPRPLCAWVGAAARDGRGGLERVAGVLRARYGAEVRLARMVPNVAFDPDETRRLLDAAQLIYIAGGDVHLLAERVRAGGFDEAIRRRHREGAVVVGVSAGAIGLTRYWVQFPEDDEPALAHPTRFACIGALELAVDVHDEESDWEELRALLAAWAREEPAATVEAWGIPRGGALEVTDAGVTHLGPRPKRLRLDRGHIVE